MKIIMIMVLITHHAFMLSTVQTGDIIIMDITTHSILHIIMVILIGIMGGHLTTVFIWVGAGHIIIITTTPIIITIGDTHIMDMATQL